MLTLSCHLILFWSLWGFRAILLSGNSPICFIENFDNAIPHHFSIPLPVQFRGQVSNRICEVIFGILLMASLVLRWNKSGHSSLKFEFALACQASVVFSLMLCFHSSCLPGSVWGKSTCHTGVGRTCLPSPTAACAGCLVSPVTLVSVPTWRNHRCQAWKPTHAPPLPTA